MARRLGGLHSWQIAAAPRWLCAEAESNSCQICDQPAGGRFRGKDIPGGVSVVAPAMPHQNGAMGGKLKRLESAWRSSLIRLWLARWYAAWCRRMSAVATLCPGSHPSHASGGRSSLEIQGRASIIDRHAETAALPAIGENSGMYPLCTTGSRSYESEGFDAHQLESQQRRRYLYQQGNSSPRSLVLTGWTSSRQFHEPETGLGHVREQHDSPWTDEGDGQA